MVVGKQRSRCFFSLARLDLEKGFSATAMWYVIAFMCIVTLAMMFITSFQSLKGASSQYGGQITSFSLFDILFYYFRGSPEYIPGERPFLLPIEWLILQILIATIVASYPKNDYDSFADQHIVRAKSRLLWWLSKVVWVLLAVAAFYMIIALVSIIATALFGDIGSLSLSSALAEISYGISFQHVSMTSIELYLLVPFAVSAALSLLQVAFSFLVGPSISYAALMAFYAVSVYYKTNVLIGDYGMLERCSLFSSGGAELLPALSVCAVVGIAAVALGGIVLMRKDLLQRSDR